MIINSLYNRADVYEEANSTAIDHDDVSQNDFLYSYAYADRRTVKLVPVKDSKQEKRVNYGNNNILENPKDVSHESVNKTLSDNKSNYCNVNRNNVHCELYVNAEAIPTNPSSTCSKAILYYNTISD